WYSRKASTPASCPLLEPGKAMTEPTGSMGRNSDEAHQMALRTPRRQRGNSDNAQASDRTRSYRRMPAPVRRGQIERGDIVSKVDKQALRELAEKATPGAWGKDGVYVCTTITAGETIYVQTWNAVAESHQESNAQFIAAANPATVLALLDEIKTLEGLYHMHRETEERQMIELKAEVVALRKDANLYRALRSMHWHGSPLAVVRNPKAAIKPGHDCPSGD